MRFHAEYHPRIHAIAKAYDEARRHDEAAAAGWDARRRERHGACARIVSRLEAEGSLAPGWDVPVATDLLYALTSVRVWEELAVDRGWSMEHYAARIGETARRTLVQAAPLEPRVPRR